MRIILRQGRANITSIADTINNIGIVYKAQGQYNLALEKYTESLRIYRVIHGTDEHTSIAGTFNKLIGVGDHKIKNINPGESLKKTEKIFYYILGFR